MDKGLIVRFFYFEDFSLIILVHSHSFKMSDNGTKVYIYIVAGRIQEIQQLEFLGFLISTFHS